MIGVAVCGLGVVGSGVVKMLTESQKRLSLATGEQIELLYGVDIREVPLPIGVCLVHDLDASLKDDRVKIVVEAIGGVRIAYEYTKRALTAGRWVVTSNKELVATHGDELCMIAKEHGAEYLFEASVGGGVPILRPLNACLAGDRITEINGIVNGSTNYLLTRMKNEGLGYEEALADAKKFGYVEADPAADVEGWDARRKLAILANAAFGSRFSDEKDIPTTGISAVAKEDFSACVAFGGTLKLIAHAKKTEEGWQGWVHPAFVAHGSSFAAVNDVFNGIMVHGEAVGDVFFAGRGAGSMPTANAVIGDIIDAARHMQSGLKRNAFSDTPPFCGADIPEKAIVRITGATREEIRAILPECEIHMQDGVLAVLCAGKDAEKLSTFSGSGIPLYVI